MTATPIDEVASAGEGGSFFKTEELAGIPLIIHGYNEADGQSGVYPIVKFTRQDTGETGSFGGGMVVYEQLQKVKAKDAFPVSGVLEKKFSPNTKRKFWVLRSPDGPAGTPIGNEAARNKKINELMKAGSIQADTVKDIVADVHGSVVKVATLSDTEFEIVVDRLNEIVESQSQEAAF